jgi:hypothetical protein
LGVGGKTIETSRVHYHISMKTKTKKKCFSENWVPNPIVNHHVPTSHAITGGLYHDADDFGHAWFFGIWLKYPGIA